MNNAQKHPYESPLCATVQLQHRELIASSPMHYTLLVTTITTPEAVSIDIEGLGYENF